MSLSEGTIYNLQVYVHYKAYGNDDHVEPTLKAACDAIKAASEEAAKNNGISVLLSVKDEFTEMQRTEEALTMVYDSMGEEQAEKFWALDRELRGAGLAIYPLQAARRLNELRHRE